VDAGPDDAIVHCLRWHARRMSLLQATSLVCSASTGVRDADIMSTDVVQDTTTCHSKVPPLRVLYSLYCAGVLNCMMWLLLVFRDFIVRLVDWQPWLHVNKCGNVSFINNLHHLRWWIILCNYFISSWWWHHSMPVSLFLDHTTFSFFLCSVFCHGIAKMGHFARIIAGWSTAPCHCHQYQMLHRQFQHYIFICKYLLVCLCRGARRLDLHPAMPCHWKKARCPRKHPFQIIKYDICDLYPYRGGAGISYFTHTIAASPGVLPGTLPSISWGSIHPRWWSWGS